MTPLALFTDGSVHPPTGAGYAAYFACREDELAAPPPSEEIMVKRFEKTNAARLELSALLWALEELGEQAQNATIYTDSQTITGLPDRRTRIESTDFHAKTGRLLNNHDLYRAFYQTWDKRQFTVVKLEGHTSTARSTALQRIFAQVDQAARKTLRCSRGR
ncbi:MAG: ribonuclease H [Opitutaceae bacterium]|mgnify:CR=1 FL=1|nr:ribonuclease H [Opitutaceae bacterium]